SQVRAVGILAAAVAIVGATYVAGWATRPLPSTSTRPQPDRVGAIALQPGVAADAVPDDPAAIGGQPRLWGPQAAAHARCHSTAGSPRPRPRTRRSRRPCRAPPWMPARPGSPG